MGNKAIENRINKIKEIEREIKELQAIADGLRNEIKNAMNEKNVDEIETANFIVRYKDIETTRLDSASIKKTLPDVYKMFSKVYKSKRFTIN